jgi:arachidonate 15-lipoxygenase
MLRPLLPAQDSDPGGRAARLAAERTTWRYAYDWPPGVATAAELPPGESYGLGFTVRALPAYLEIGVNLAAMSVENWARGDLVHLVRERFTGIDGASLGRHLLSTPRELASAAPLAHPETWQGYEALYATWRAPWVVAAQRDPAEADRAFAWQRIGGANPMVLARATTAPPLSPERFTTTTSGDTVAAAFTEGRLYVADYSSLAGLTAGTTDGLQKVLPAPTAWFVLDRATRALAPVAIRTGPGGDVFWPADGWRWVMARTLVQIADANHHEGVVHLGRTHMVMEAVGLALHRQLSTDHPLFVLLSPHLETTFAINQSAKTSLIAPGGTVDRVFAPTIEAFAGVVKAALDSYPLDATDPVQDLRARGLDDAGAFPGHPYRDAALPLWAAIREFTSGYVAVYYESDAEVAEDTELAAFVAELGAQDGGRLTGVPPARTRDELAYLLARFVWIAGPQHSAVNFPQFDFMSYPPNMPGASFAAPPDSSTPDDPAAFLAMLPPWKITLEGSTMVFLLSHVHDSRLGDYGLLHFKDLRVHGVVHAYQQRLAELEAADAAADAERPYPYPYLRPSGVLQSVSI